jgi:hypothetical protein
MKAKLPLSLGIAGALFLLMAAPVGAAASTSTFETSVPVAIFVGIPCAADTVLLTGNLHIVISVTTDGAGGSHVSALFNPQGITGIGSPSGAKYQGTGETRFDTQTSGPLSLNNTFVNNFKIIGQGPDNNLLVHENAHVTFNADGTLTAFIDNFSFTCM